MLSFKKTLNDFYYEFWLQDDEPLFIENLFSTWKLTISSLAILQKKIPSSGALS